MKFKYTVIGDNTAENRKHLENIGYDFEDTNKRFTPYIYTNGGCVYFVSESFALAIAIDVREKYVNCKGNDNLFKTVTAMRDDSSLCNGLHVKRQNLLSLGICAKRKTMYSGQRSKS